jgi:hypothetical protein
MAWISNYDDRPGKLFDGLEHIRASIIICHVADKNSQSIKLFSTNLLRWPSEARKNLFDAFINYGEVNGLEIEGSIPKISQPQLKSIIEKVRLENIVIASVYADSYQNIIYYYRSPLYWIRSMNFLPTFSSGSATRSVHHFKNFGLTHQEFIKPVGCIINSSLFYIWFIGYGNGRNVALRDIKKFPCDIYKISLSLGKKLSKLFDKLMEDFKVYSEIKTRKDGVKYQEFYPSHSKPIMDEIDLALAEHYGFTDEELDFIINYDIKYRMGRDNSEE